MWSDTPAGAAAETLLEHGPDQLIGQLLTLDALPFVSPDRANELAAADKLEPLRAIKLPLDKLKIMHHLEFHAKFAAEAHRVCSSGSRVRFRDVLEIYSQNVPIEIRDVFTKHTEDDAYDQYLRHSESVHLGLMVFDKLVAGALTDPARTATLTLQQQAAEKESFRTRSSLGHRGRDRSTRTSTVASLDMEDSEPQHDASIHHIAEMLTNGEITDEVAINLFTQQQQRPTRSQYDRGTPDGDCSTCGRSHPGGADFCFHVIDRHRALCPRARLEEGERMHRSAPLLAKLVCKASHAGSQAWCFPGGPSVAACGVVSNIRNIAKSGGITIYSSDIRTTVCATPEQVEAYITAFAKISQEHTCINVTS